MGVVGTELKVLKVVVELGEAEPIRIGQKAGVASHYADYLARNLLRNGYLTKQGRKFRPTPEGVYLVEQKKAALGG